ncbi:phage integrase SAM-like domain-containing protein [Dyadobacter soli]|nr:phage integrase SAM-like domain-containing protein [Dyadobacter soli]
MEVLFWKHATKSQEQKGTSTLYLRITVNGTREELGSTGLKITSADWNDASRRLNGNDPLNSFKNEQLGILEMRLWGIFNDLLRKSEKVTADRIKRAYQLPPAVSFLSAFDFYQKVYEKRKDVSESSKKTLRNHRQLAFRFLVDNNLREVLVDEFTPEVMEDYRAWCKGCGYKDSYFTRSARSLAAITKFAKRKKWVSENPLEDYVIGHERIERPEYLDSVQLRLWRNHEFSHPTAQKVADIFVLYARTGFHYQDLMQIIRNPTDFLITGIDGKQWIVKPRQKTEVEAKVPIDNFPEVKEVINKYGGWSKVPTYCNAKMNDWLKICAAELNMRLVPAQRIYPQLSVKHGRTTFCDYCLNELGLSREAILTMMGRISAAELDRYVRSDERAVITSFKISEAALAS